MQKQALKRKAAKSLELAPDAKKPRLVKLSKAQIYKQAKNKEVLKEKKAQIGQQGKDARKKYRLPGAKRKRNQIIEENQELLSKTTLKKSRNQLF